MSDQNETPEKSEQPVTRVVNLYRDDYDVYIGRKGKGKDGYFGNPFDMRDFTREECISRFKEHFLSRVKTDSLFRMKVLDLRGKRLGCFCKPNACHGDVIVEWINKMEIQCALPPVTTGKKFDGELREMKNNVDAANLPDDIKIPEVHMHEGVALGGKKFKVWYNDNKAFIMTRVCQQRTALFEKIATPRRTEAELDHALYQDKRRRIYESLTG